ncbi:MAG: hypothetical protein DCC68_25725 [Planctomycetota bacterium]|nr:MAG: hypothetical protein DCC68_25725 [Planctomycetota bacterium]
MASLANVASRRRRRARSIVRAAGSPKCSSAIGAAAISHLSQVYPRAFRGNCRRRAKTERDDD